MGSHRFDDHLGGQTMSYDHHGRVVTGAPDFVGDRPKGYRWCPKEWQRMHRAVCATGNCGRADCEHYKQAAA